jgi:threonine dehydrogenase-like Zn-dependent dehydrogenase
LNYGSVVTSVGGQAEYLRVPYADVGPSRSPDGNPDEHVLFLSEIFPDRIHGSRERRDRTRGAGLVGQLAMRSAWMLGAGRVIAIDNVPERLQMAATYGKAKLIDFDDVMSTTDRWR